MNKYLNIWVYKCITMVEQGKVSGFRLPNEVLEKLDNLIKEGKIKNRTEGVINAINLYEQYEKYSERPFARELYLLTQSDRVVSDWVFFDDNTKIILRDAKGNEDYLVKNGLLNAKIIRKSGKDTITITLEGEFGDYH